MVVRDAVHVALRIALVALGSYICGFHFTNFIHGASAGIGALWSVISAIAVLQMTRDSTLSSVWLQLPGTAIGSAVSAAYLVVLPFSAIGMGAAIFVTVLLCSVARVLDHARMAAATVAMMMVVASLIPTIDPVLSGLLRFCESCIGTGIALLAVWAWPGPAKARG